jgi:hypothetical protein
VDGEIPHFLSSSVFFIANMISTGPFRADFFDGVFLIKKLQATTNHHNSNPYADSPGRFRDHFHPDDGTFTQITD